MPKFRTKFAYGRQKKKKDGRARKTTGRPSMPDQSAQETSFSKCKSMVEEQKAQLDDSPDAADKTADLYLLVNYAFISALAEKILCKSCKSPCLWQLEKRRGFAHEIKVYCSKCNETILERYTSEQVEIAEPENIQKHLHHDAKKATKRASDGVEEIEVKKAKKSTGTTNGKDSGESVENAVIRSYPVKEATTDGRKFNLKIVSWNVAGLRAWAKKDGHKWLLESEADIMCLQETKCDEKKAPEDLKDIPGYHVFWNAGEKAGHNGVCLISKVKPDNVEIGIPDKPEHSKEGRTLTAEYEKFYLVCSYVPNSGRGLVRLDYRQEWNKDFQNYLKKLDEKKPVILCGDLNVSHQEIDLKNPKPNKKNAGFTQQERDDFTELLSQGFIDSFRKLYPEREGAYTFWTYMGSARAKNVGWRLDYFVLSERMEKDVCDNVIHSKVMGSDHCPVSLLLALD